MRVGKYNTGKANRLFKYKAEVKPKLSGWGGGSKHFKKLSMAYSSDGIAGDYRSKGPQFKPR